MPRDILSSLSDAEADTLLTVLKKLPLRSLLRLYSSCSTLKRFITRHQASIRASLLVSVKLEVLVDRVRFSIDVDDSTSKQIRIKKKENIVGDFIDDLVWQATDKHVARKQEDGWIISSEAPLETAMQLLSGPFRDYRIDILDFCYLLKDVRLNWEGNFVHSPDIEGTAYSLVQFLSEEDRRVDKLMWPVIQAAPSRVLPFIDNLHVQDLELIVKRTEVSHEEWDLNREFFQGSRTLRKFTANDLNCEIGDEDLKRFNCLMVTKGRTALSVSAIVAWAQRKLLEGCYGDELKLTLSEPDVLELRRSLEGEFFFKRGDTNPPYWTTMDFRGPTGTWMKFTTGANPDRITDLIIMESFSSPQESLESSKEALFGWPRELVFSVQIDASDAHLWLSTGQGSIHGEFVFQLGDQLPDDAFFIEKWADDVLVYNIGSQNYLIQIVKQDEERLSERKKTEVLRLLGEKLRDFKFNKARCESDDSDAALKLLQKVHGGYQGGIGNLSVHGDRGPNEGLLIETIQLVEPKRFSFAFNNEEESNPPWRLSERFFIETPTLRAFTLRPLFYWHNDRSETKHFLGITDESLLRFQKFKAPTAVTLVTKTGIRNWIRDKFHVDIPFGEEDKVLKCFNPRGKVHARFVTTTQNEEGVEEQQEGSERRLLSISLMDATKRGEGGTYIEQEWNSDFMYVRDRESSGWDSNEGSWAYQLEGRSY